MTGPVAMAAARARGLLRGGLRNEAGAMLMAFTAATIVLRLGSNVVLTHMLDPRIFGVMAVIASVTTILNMLSDLGFGNFVVGHPDGGDPRVLDVAWTIRLGQATAQGLVMLAAAVPVAAFLGKPEMAWPIAVCAPLFLAYALTPMSALLAQREGKVRIGCAIELGSLIVQIAVNIGFALVIRDYMALVIGLYAGNAARVLLTMLLLRTPSHIRFDRAIAREFFGYSRVIVASTIVTLLITQSDKVVFARLFSLGEFGIYMLATNFALATLPFGRNYVQRYLFPLVSRTWRDDPAALVTVYYGARRRIYPLMFATFGFAAGLAPLIFALLFDHRYEQGWLLLSILLVRNALDLDSFASSQALFAIGRTATMLHSNILRAALFAGLVFALYTRLGVLSVPVALVAAEFGTLLYFAVLLQRADLLRFRPLAVYYAVLAATFAAGATVSVLAVPEVIARAFEL
jgi:lipopolysaccharide exporter